MGNQAVVVLDPKELTSSTKIDIGGASITSSSSPYDIPKALESYRDKLGGPYVFEVKYMGPDEPFDLFKLDTGVEVKAGRNSKRVYAFIVHPTDPSSKSSVLGAIKSTVDKLQTLSTFTSKDNYNLIRSAFARVGDQVLDKVMSGDTGPITKSR